MKQFKVIITFNDGDEINSKVAASNPSDALQRVFDNEKAIEFIASHDDIKSVDISFIGDYNDIKEDPERFILSLSQEKPGWIVAADRNTNMVLMFKEGAFEDTVEYKPLEDMTPLDAATAVRELGDYLRLYYAGLLERDDETSRQFNRLRIGALIAKARKRKGLTIRELAERCGVSYQNITKIENGRYNVSIDILNKMCSALDCRIDLRGL